MTLNKGFTYREKLGPAATGITLLDYLTAHYQHSTNEDWRTRIDSGRIRVNGRPADQTTVLRPGQTLTWHRPPWREPQAPTGFAILFIDAHLLAVAKPRGLPMMPGGGFLTRTLLHLVRQQYPEATPLHRLGRGTSGLALFGRSDLARSTMTSAWQEGEILRIYRALVRGRLEENELDIQVPIGPVFHPLLGDVHAVSETGKPSRSRARLIEFRDTMSLVEVEILTGRPHQIRIHLAAAGHPLCGDPLYPIGGVPDPAARALPGDPGYYLHAERLSFRHPETKKQINIQCTPPPVLRRGVGQAVPGELIDEHANSIESK